MKTLAPLSPLLILLSFGTLNLPPASAQMPLSMPGNVLIASTPSPVLRASPTAPRANPTPVPLSDVVMAAESAQITLQNMEQDLNSDPIMASATDELPTLSRELAARLNENTKILAASPSLDTLRSLGTDWRGQANSLQQKIKELTNRVEQLDHFIDLLASLDVTWQQTLSSVKISSAPPDILQRIKSIIARTDTVGEKVAKRRSQILELQNTVVDQEARVEDARTAVRFARDDAVSRLFARDSPPVWRLSAAAEADGNLTRDSQTSFLTQLTVLGAYARRAQSRFLIQALVALLLASSLRFVRTKIAPLRKEDADIDSATRVLDKPYAIAVVVSLLLCAWIYPQPPRLFWAIMGAIALIPTAILLRQITDRSMYAIIKALLVFYFFDQLRSISASLPFLPRLLFMAETFGAVLLLIWLVRTSSRARQTSPILRQDHFRRAVLLAARFSLVLLAAAFVANGLGFVSLSNLVGDAVFRSAYFAVFLFAVLHIVDAVVLLSLRVRPLRLLGAVARHRQLLYRRIHRFLVGIVFVLWIARTLDLLSLLGPAFELARALLRATVVIGSVHLSLGNVLVFGITVWASILLSNFLRFLLDEDIYPRLSLPRGLPYAISTMLHYTVLVAGFFIAVAAMGFDMTKFTILAGAFGVGLGFGLQNIVNNFVSGLILLFERPVNVGDVIQMDDASGVVQSIGIRASIIRTSSGSEIIVPNGKLISDRVTNWTLSNNLRGIVIPMSVTSGSDPRHVIEVLTAVAAAHPMVAKDPSPQALFIKFGPATLDFELHAWTDQFSTWEQIRSDLAVAINTAFSQESIAMP